MHAALKSKTISEHSELRPLLLMREGTIWRQSMNMKFLAWLVLLAVLFLSSPVASPAPLPTDAQTISVASHQAGPTPFISFLSLVSHGPFSDIASIRFTITPKPGSFTRPISVIYSRSYLQSRGYLDPRTRNLILPVFGLYANYSNTVVVNYSFTRHKPQQQNIVVPTGSFSDPCGFNNRIAIQARTNSTTLSYDYMLLKNACGDFSPTILDTDGEIRWVGTAGLAYFASTMFQNAVYLGNGPNLYRMEFDGAVSVAATYPNGGTAHHNIDYGKVGMILDEDVPGQIESFNAEVDAQGNVLKVWSLAAIITDAMIAGGDDPSQFVYPAPTDWFHNNAVAYRRSDDSLVISSRENFVICIDYATGAIKWILGDPTKKWYQFPSLRQYALALAPNSLPPIGQHAVSFTADDKLLLFDDGRGSLFQTPPGDDRTYSAPRKYQLDLTTKVATEEWNYPNGQTLYSPFCSSVYEDSPLNYLVDYSIISNLGPIYMELLGLDASGAKIFDYRYLTSGCDDAWNAIPIHLENLQFTAP